MALLLRALVACAVVVVVAGAFEAAAGAAVAVAKVARDAEYVEALELAAQLAPGWALLVAVVAATVRDQSCQALVAVH